ncbi:type VII secretion protein EccB [Dactylosporangium aurantiacum]|uniref:Type VII secretion protein EccB n=2 Tax=Dactylosporangium aurantiacum TaxID=35754 RepID=A0A9Q9IF46_9ACTN|nr:type VII secretion protein EccB [Dactylosporangium aurantiacum]MDG6101045.1 type VII secretion protein EccB [Dactylosporangium aurantiacum]UWZ54917.1 type VII secretion protein EccB [Dactylosporangium aurantiacum]
MASRQDQLHSYQFTVQRVVAALVMRETDPLRSPFRRVAGATLVGMLLAALGIGGAAAYAVIVPGTSGKWRNENAVIVEKESGALFVYREQRLHPVLNQASALLILNRPGAQTVSVGRKALAGAPRGATLGIPGAPASLPTARTLHRAPWVVCASSTESTLFIGGQAGGGGAPLGDRGLLVTGPSKAIYLLFHGRKHLIRQPGAVLPALVWSGRPQTAVAQALLHAVPSGQDLVTPPVADRGRKVDGRTVGQLFGVRSGDRVDAFVLTGDGLATVTPLQAALLLAAPETATVQGRAELLPLTPGELAALVRDRPVRPLVAGAGLPAAVPELLDSVSGVACTTSEATLTTGNVLPEAPGALRTTSSSPAGTVLADKIVVAPGGGALVRTDTGNLTLVTDLGRRHALPVAGVLSGLGYQGVEPVTVPGEFVGLLPVGPALDPEQALSSW